MIGKYFKSNFRYSKKGKEDVCYLKGLCYWTVIKIHETRSKYFHVCAGRWQYFFRTKTYRYYDTFTSIFVSHKFTRKEILAGKDVLSACTQHKGGH